MVSLQQSLLEEAQWTTIHTFSGTGTQQTVSFHIGERWPLVWRRNAAIDERQDYVIVLQINVLDPRSSGVKVVQELTTPSEVKEMYGRGMISLYLLSGSVWSVQVQEWQPAGSRAD